jgi:hypothetical protein
LAVSQYQSVASRRYKTADGIRDADVCDEVDQLAKMCLGSKRVHQSGRFHGPWQRS